jgi:hypothetical protein
VLTYIIKTRPYKLPTKVAKFNPRSSERLLPASLGKRQLKRILENNLSIRMFRVITPKGRVAFARPLSAEEVGLIKTKSGWAEL